MLCCASCFGDIGLHSILPSLSSKHGTCDFCGTEHAALVEPGKLLDLFSTVTNIYEENEEGKELIQWFRDDWAMFSNSQMKDSRVEDLLVAIVGDAGIVGKRFKPSERFKSDRLERWEQLTEELRNRNRYLPEIKIDFERLKELPDFLYAKDLPSTWFRARINANDTAFPIEEMGAPPIGTAAHGRANPPDIPYLYVGSTLKLQSPKFVHIQAKKSP